MLRRTRSRRLAILPRAATHAAIVVVVIISASRLFGFFGEGVDFHAYWAVDLADPYTGSYSYGPDAFLYSPLFAQLTEPLRWLPYPVALALWTALELGCLLYLAGPWTLPLMLPLASEWMNGNVHLVMAAAVVVSFRAPGLWIVPAMTKLSPGVGLLWHVLRGEWAYVLRAGTVIAALFGASFLVAPELWFGWARLILDNAGAMPPPGSVQVPMILRFGVALALVVWAARTGRQWPVPLAVAFGLPVLWWAGLIAMAIAAWRLRRLYGRNTLAHHLNGLLVPPNKVELEPEPVRYRSRRVTVPPDTSPDWTT